MKSAAEARPSGGLELWLLRHGATEWSRNGRHTGRSDLPLLAEGEAEARALAPLLQGITFTAVATSPLQRARRTCELAGLAEGALVWDDLREWDYGAYEGITTAEIRRGQSDWTIWSHGCPAGENAAAVQSRCERLIAQALALADQPARTSNRDACTASEGTPVLPPFGSAPAPPIQPDDRALVRASASNASASSSSSASPAPLGVAPCRIALFAHGHLLRSLAATWLGLGAHGGRLFVLGTGGISVLGYEREQRALLRWNVTVRG